MLEKRLTDIAMEASKSARPGCAQPYEERGLTAA